MMHSFLRLTSPFPSQWQRIKFLSESAETLCALTYNVLVLEQIHLYLIHHLLQSSWQTIYQSFKSTGFLLSQRKGFGIWFSH